jgi:hypothetical protein
MGADSNSRALTAITAELTAGFMRALTAVSYHCGADIRVHHIKGVATILKDFSAA